MNLHIIKIFQVFGGFWFLFILFEIGRIKEVQLFMLDGGYLYNMVVIFDETLVVSMFMGHQVP